MRYKLDLDGYVNSVAFGSYLQNCIEYTGTVPIGYNSLEDWATYSCVNAYYVNSSGNLVLDSEKLSEIRRKEAQEKADNTPLLRKDLYGSEEVLDSQYKRQVETGEVVVLEDIKTISPRVKITGINPYTCNKLSVYTQGKNMMPCNAVAQTISGVSFSKNYNGSITVSGTATKDVDYTISGSNANETLLFALKKNHSYYLNLGGLKCELRYYDGETIYQQYVGASGLLKLAQSIEVTHVMVKIPRGTKVNTTFYPQLEYGSTFTSYEAHKLKSLDIDLGEFAEALFPSNTLYPSDTLYPKGDILNYVLIENGIVYRCLNSILEVVDSGNVGLFGSYSIIYASKDTILEVEYSTNVYDVADLEFMQGKATTTNKFKVLKDGSIEAHNGYFSGEIQATSGNFKGSIISDNAVITGGSLAVGKDFSVSNTGTVLAKYGVVGPWIISPDTFITEDYGFQITLQSDGTWHINNGNGDMRVDGVNANEVTTRDMYAYGTKSRVSATENYGERLLYCYEMPSPVFGDLGEGQIDDTGKCYVFLDEVFSETVDTDCVYQVFLQPYGEGKCYVTERTSTHFVVCGTENMKFGWEVKAIQKHYDTRRLEEHESTKNVDSVAVALKETSNYLNTLLYDVESEEF